MKTKKKKFKCSNKIQFQRKIKVKNKIQCQKRRTPAMRVYIKLDPVEEKKSMNFNLGNGNHLI